MEKYSFLIEEGRRLLANRVPSGTKLIYDSVDKKAYNRWVLNCISILQNSSEIHASQIKAIYQPDYANVNFVDQILGIVESAADIIKMDEETKGQPSKEPEGSAEKGPAVFISHISEEAGLAIAFKKWISKLIPGSEVFVSSDPSDLPPGEKWLETISHALKSCKVLLILCSQESINRPWVNFEAGGGWVKGVLIIPICHRDLKKNKLPVPLSHLQGINLSDDDFCDVIIARIASVLGALGIQKTDYKNMLSELRDVSERKAVASEMELSEDAIAVLELLLKSGSKEIGMIRSGGKVHLSFTNNSGAISGLDDRFIEEDMGALVSMGLLSSRDGPSGVTFFGFTRKGMDFAKQRSNN